MGCERESDDAALSERLQALASPAAERHPMPWRCAGESRAVSGAFTEPL